MHVKLVTGRCKSANCPHQSNMKGLNNCHLTCGCVSVCVNYNAGLVLGVAFWSSALICWLALLMSHEWGGRALADRDLWPLSCPVHWQNFLENEYPLSNRMALLWVCPGTSLPAQLPIHTSGYSCHTPAADIIMMAANILQALCQVLELGPIPIEVTWLKMTFLLSEQQCLVWCVCNIRLFGHSDILDGETCSLDNCLHVSTKMATVSKTEVTRTEHT